MTSEGWETIPHAVFNYHPEITEFLKVADEINSGRVKQDKLTINTILLRVIVEGLKACPVMNSHIEYNQKFAKGTITQFENIDISMPAILSSGEMMTLNMHGFENKTISEMRDAINETRLRADNSDINEVMYETAMDNTLICLKKGRLIKVICRLLGTKIGRHRIHTLKGAEKRNYYSIPESKRLTKDDIKQGTITISNTGSLYKEMRGECTVLEIIPPQASAICIGAVQLQAIADTDVNGNPYVRTGSIIPLTIAFDHRALDAQDLALFIKKLDGIFACPEIIKNWI